MVLELREGQQPLPNFVLIESPVAFAVLEFLQKRLLYYTLIGNVSFKYQMDYSILVCGNVLELQES